MQGPVHTIEGQGAGGNPFSAEFQAAVRAEVETMLKAPVFSQSGRCKVFLSHIVFQTLSGNANQLKERTIGVSVFDRPSDYDTGDDSIVRVTANEVRKRLGQFYRESPVIHPIQIELPRGAYVPEFRVQASKRAKEPDEIKSVHPIEAQAASWDQPLLTKNDGASAIGSTIVSEPEPGAQAERVLSDRKRMRLRLTYAAGAVLVLVTCAMALGVWRMRSLRSEYDIWGSFVNSHVPVLVCIDTHDLHIPTPPSSPEAQRFVNLVLYKRIISLDDAAVLSSMTGVLGKKGIPFRLVGAADISLSDFRRQPVILIGAIDNKWTLLLSQNLPYRIEVANPPGSGSGKEPVASIIDAHNPTGGRWTTDLSMPFTSWKMDYAIVARMDDATTGVPVLIEAGLGNDGSIAASELILTGTIAARLKLESSCREKSNFEAVVGTELIDTRPGPPHILRITCW